MLIKNLLVVAFCLLSFAVITIAEEKKVELKKEEGSGADKVAVISYDDLKKAITEKKVVLLDCNGNEKFASGHIPTAINNEAADADTKLPADKAALIVAYCGSEKCTAWKGGAKKLTKLGYTNVKHFSGGLKGWTDAGGELEK